MDRLGEMEAFVAVVREGGFSAAARKLGLTASALSKQIARLEDRLGVSLLHRTTRRVELTDVGQAYYDGSRAIVGEVGALEDAVAQYQAGPKGVVRVSLSPTLARYQVTSMLPGFYARYPDIRLVFELTESYVDLVQQRVDVAVRIGELEDSSFVTRKIARFARVIGASPDYLERHGTPRTPGDLRNHNCLTLSLHRRTMNRWEFAGPEGPEAIEVSGNFEANTVQALQDAAEAGVGIARVAPLVARASLATGRLVPLLTEYTSQDQTTLQILYPSKRHQSRAVRVVIDALTAHVQAAEADAAAWMAGVAKREATGSD